MKCQLIFSGVIFSLGQLKLLKKSFKALSRILAKILMAREPLLCEITKLEFHFTGENKNANHDCAVRDLTMLKFLMRRTFE